MLGIMLTHEFRFKQVFEEVVDKIICQGKITVGPTLMHKLLKILFEKKLHSSQVKVLEFIMIQRISLPDNTLLMIQRELNQVKDEVSKPSLLAYYDRIRKQENDIKTFKPENFRTQFDEFNQKFAESQKEFQKKREEANAYLQEAEAKSQKAEEEAPKKQEEAFPQVLSD
mmetsp:Transcript_28465/g.25298  ORF Transcript_28465/g.25298 Transcript_28465/m.25298 type:complete len:170 (+) Transcript_28465:8307-8816(+)